MDFHEELERKEWTRYRLLGAPNTPEWAFIHYHDHEDHLTLKKLAQYLIKFGRWQKIVEIMEP